MGEKFLKIGIKKQLACQRRQYWGDLPHSGLVDQILPLPIIFHVREIGGEHGIEGEDLLLDGATISDLQKKPPYMR